MEGVDGLVVCVLGHTLADEGQVCARCGRILVSLGSKGQHDAVSSSTTSGERPVEIGVVHAVGDQMFAGAGDNLPLKSLVSAQAVARG